MDSYTFEETAARLSVYEAWASVAREAGGRELYEGPDPEGAKPLAAPGPLENLKDHQPGRYTVHQLYDAYRICKLLGPLVQRGNHVYSRGPGEQRLRPESQLEFLLGMLSRR